MDSRATYSEVSDVAPSRIAGDIWASMPYLPAVTWERAECAGSVTMVAELQFRSCSSVATTARVPMVSVPVG
jgi:hypothetical protein